MEEAVGKLWHKWITRAAQRDFPDQKIELETIHQSVSLYFHAFGGDPGLTIKAATSEDWQAKRSFTERIAGKYWQVQLCWKDKECLFLPYSISAFPDIELNKKLYLWLAALAALPQPEIQNEEHSDNWIDKSQHNVLQTLKQWPGLQKTYLALAKAHIAQRQWPNKTALMDDERNIRQAILQPGTVQSTLQNPKLLEPAIVWLHPIPPEASPLDTNPLPEIEAESDKIDEVKSNSLRKAKRATHGKHDEGLLAFRLESLFSWAEFINIDRPEEDDEDLDAAKTANDLDEFAVSNRSGTVKKRLKFDLDLPGSDYDDHVIHRGTQLPEWDYRKQSLIPNYCNLDIMSSKDNTPCSLPSHLRKSAQKIRSIFEHMALQKQWMRMQHQGSEIDWDAYLDAVTRWKLGQESHIGLFKEVKQHHRDLSCLLLADLSLSTEAAVDDEHAVIDVIRDALFLMSEALSASGDRYAIAGFSSKQRHMIRYYPMKGFHEPISDKIRGNIHAIRPGFYTRLGAAIRYATQSLEKEKTSHRLLMILSDGKPNDVDRYDGRYGIEDTRMAILQAKKSGIVPFCVTIDNRANEYLPYLFGHEHYVVIRNAKQLPEKLPQLYRKLTETV